MKLAAGVLLFTQSDSFIDIACHNCTFFALTVSLEIASESNRICSNSQVQQVSLFQYVYEKMGSRTSQEIKVDDIALSSGGKKVEQGGNVQVSQYFNLQVISSVVTKSGHIMMRETGRQARATQLQATVIVGSHAIVENFQMFVERFERPLNV